MNVDDHIGEGERPASCRDRGWRGVDAGALCLSWVGNHDPWSLRAPRASWCGQDRHKAPLTPTSTPCPYTMGRHFGDAPIRLSKFIRDLNDGAWRRFISHYSQPI